MTDETYTTTEVSKILKIDPQSVVNMIHDGRLKAFKIGRYYRITQQTLNEYIKKMEVKNAT